MKLIIATLFLLIFFIPFKISAQTSYLKSYPINSHKKSFSLLDTTIKFHSLIPSNFVYCSYGFFCKQEIKLEKKSNLPIKFRVGNVEQCNWLEGKSRYKPINN